MVDNDGNRPDRLPENHTNGFIVRFLKKKYIKKHRLIMCGVPQGSLLEPAVLSIYPYGISFLDKSNSANYDND